MTDQRAAVAPVSAAPAPATGSRGIIHGWCDPYGAESQIKLMGGIYPPSMVGRIMWHCNRPADAGRFRMVCRGGAYGERLAADGGALEAYRCDGGHRGVIMPLCADHRRMISRRQAGVCPACCWPPRARDLAQVLEARQADLYNASRLGLYGAAARIQSALEQLQAEMTELYTRGIVHRCPLQLVEVS